MPFDPNAFTEDVRRRREQQPAVTPPADTSGFNPSEFAGSTQQITPYSDRPITGGDVATTAATGIGSAAATAFGYNLIPGVKGPSVTPGMAYDAVGRPILNKTGDLFRSYLANPLLGVRDVAATKVAPGVIPAQIVKGAAPEIAANIDNIISKVPKGSDVMARQFLSDLSPDDLAKFKQQVDKVGLEQAFKTFEAPKYIHGEAAEGLKFMKSAFPSGMAKLGTAAAMLGRTASKFAGPIGLLSTVYDVYEYGPKVYDWAKEKMNPPAAPVAPQPQSSAPAYGAPVAPVQPTGGQAFDMDRRIREEAYKRAMGLQ